ncbi:MAG: type II toxin-antitoxin system RelE/ParE family toxin [Flavobacterium micromati]|nr:type II toxin-antitoxin system RelE/ParE family toxin [Flavobacterium micromati]
MRIKLTKEFNFDLLNIVDFIAKDKPIAAKKFKKDLLHNLEKDFKNPFHFKKSIYSDDENIRDYVFEEYVIVYEIDMEQQIVSVSDL